MEQKKKAFAVASLRRASYRWPGRFNALKAAHIGRNQYICEKCGPDKIHPKKNVQLDHRAPIVPVTGWDGFDGFIDRLLCDVNGFSVLCKEHHSTKTSVENQQRKDNKKRTVAKTVPKKK